MFIFLFLSPSIPHVLSFFFLLGFLSSALSAAALLGFLFPSSLSPPPSFLLFPSSWVSLLLSFLFPLPLPILLLHYEPASPLSSAPFLRFFLILSLSSFFFPPPSSSLLVFFSFLSSCFFFLLCFFFLSSVGRHPLFFSVYFSSSSARFPSFFLLLSLCCFCSSSFGFFSLSSFFLWLPLLFVLVFLSLFGLFSSSSSFSIFLSLVFPLPSDSVIFLLASSSYGRGFAFFRLFFFFLFCGCLHPRVLLRFFSFFLAAFRWLPSLSYALLSSFLRYAAEAYPLSSSLPCSGVLLPAFLLRFFLLAGILILRPSTLIICFCSTCASACSSPLRLLLPSSCLLPYEFSYSFSTVAHLRVVSVCSLFLLPACLIAS